MEAKTLVDSLADRLAEMDMQTSGETRAEVEAKAPRNIQRDRIAEKVDTTCGPVTEEEAEVLKSETLVDKLAERLSKWRIRQPATHWQRWRPMRWTKNWLIG